MTYSEQVATRLVEFLQGKVGKEHGWKKKAAELLEMDRQNIAPYLLGERVPAQTVLARLHKLGCDVNWLLYGDQIDPERAALVSLMQVPVYESVHAGTRNEVIMDGPSYTIAIPRVNDDTVFGVKVKGGSMAAAGIPDGAVVLCSRKESFANGKPHLVSWNNGETALRSVHQDGTFFTLSSSDPMTYPPMRVNKKDIHFLYRVTKIIIDL